MCSGGNCARPCPETDDEKLRFAWAEVEYQERLSKEARDKLIDLETMIAQGSDKPDESTI